MVIRSPRNHYHITMGIWSIKLDRACGKMKRAGKFYGHMTVQSSSKEFRSP